MRFQNISGGERLWQNSRGERRRVQQYRALKNDNFNLTKPVVLLELFQYFCTVQGLTPVFLKKTRFVCEQGGSPWWMKYGVQCRMSLSKWWGGSLFFHEGFYSSSTTVHVTPHWPKPLKMMVLMVARLIVLLWSQISHESSRLLWRVFICAPDMPRVRILFVEDLRLRYDLL